MGVWTLDKWWKKAIYILGWIGLFFNIFWFMIGFIEGYFGL